ncbi:MAG TPA: hypothetical protein VFV87_05755 [Pirellulaceae bacterium]|nr:hypothetical protein [Pirellulaceae bacterium]
MTLRFSLLSLIGLTTLAGLASAALVQPGVGWTSVVVSLTVAMFAWQVLRAILTNDDSRAAAIGWIFFAAAYLAIVLGPWLSSRLGPQLLSSRALVHAQVNWRKESINLPLDEYQRRVGLDLWGLPVEGRAPSLIFDTSGSALWTTQVISAGPSPTDSANHFQLSGHWLCAWLAGWIGAVLAAQFWRNGRSRRR